MTEEFLKNKNIWIGVMVANQEKPENYYRLTYLLDEYANQKDQEWREKIEAKIDSAKTEPYTSLQRINAVVCYLKELLEDTK